jgi:hypothetical protein
MIRQVLRRAVPCLALFAPFLAGCPEDRDVVGADDAGSDTGHVVGADDAGSDTGHVVNPDAGCTEIPGCPLIPAGCTVGPGSCVNGVYSCGELSCPDSGTRSDDAGEGGTSVNAGTLTLQAIGGTSGEVAAQVPLVEPGVGQQKTCAAPVVAGACQLTSCQLGGVGDPSEGYGNFGPITASIGTTTVPITYNGFGYGTVYFPSSITLGEGGIMTFRGGNGASVPTFDVSATIPGLAVITAPAPATDGGAATIDTSEDLSVTWVPISIGQIQFELTGGASPSQIGGTAISIACAYDGSSGSGAVAQSLLSSLKQMSGTTAVYANLSSELEATTVVDGLTIVTQSYQSSPTTGHSFGVTLQ